MLLHTTVMALRSLTTLVIPGSGAVRPATRDTRSAFMARGGDCSRFAGNHEGRYNRETARASPRHDASNNHGCDV